MKNKEFAPIMDFVLSDEETQQKKGFNVIPFLIFPISIIYFELILKCCTTTTLFDIGLLFVPLFSVAAGTLISVFCSLFSEKVNHILVRAFLFLLAILFSTQIVYHWCFDKYLILYSVGAGGAGQVIEDGILDVTLRTIKACAFPILLTFVPDFISNSYCVTVGPT